MTSFRNLLLSSAVLAVSAAPAFAADVIETIPQPPVAIDVPFSWTGAYVGAQIGFLNADVTASVDGGTNNAIADADGFIGGVHAGFNFEFRNFIVGVYADIDGSKADIDLGAVDPKIGEVNYVARGMLKAGASYDRALLYVQGGVAYIDADFDAAGNASGLDESDDEYGYVVGAGIDYAVTDNIIVGGDYLYHSFDGLGEGENILGVVDGNEVESDVDAHTFRAKFAYKF